ncbi:hypothetical protein KGQ20_41820 [Catenulispora sp. NF23]|uniref:hypothetical protein n=1 Tax=Catenulispora pinistramenti TaxID=2705254 RepID=UPI001BAC0932|nr:hypothetical protein [Catenulispora pinistramenti]MBS2539304.1 hypothetical protein [Catenulispora pinistramenti]
MVTHLRVDDIRGQEWTVRLLKIDELPALAEIRGEGRTDTVLPKEIGILGTPANIGNMSGALKRFLDPDERST